VISNVKHEMSKLILYSYFRSSCSWRVRTALALKKLDYEYRSVDLLQDEQYTETYKKVNPQGYVPTLLVNGKPITQSISIMEYLDEVYPEIPLLPRGDPIQKADVRSLCLSVVADIQPLQNISPIKRINDKTFGHWAVTKGFNALERRLQETAGTCCYGDDITMADICLIPQVTNARYRFKVDLDNYPIISRIENRLKGHEAFLKAHPENQPDYPQGWVQT